MQPSAYYDEHVPRRLKDFVFGNRRIDAALKKLTRGLSTPPRSVLEVGCGIGFVAFHLKRRWTVAHVVALDTSQVSIDVARRLFGDSGVLYAHGRIEELDFREDFDLIVLMDVYEHVEIDQRESLYQRLSELLSPTGSLFVSVPTPEYQWHLRTSRPSGLQPVDEDVSAADLERLAHACHATIMSYERISVWRKLDYAHCWIRRVPGAGAERVTSGTLLARVGRRIRKALSFNRLEQRRRAARVVRRLGVEWLDAANKA